MSQDNDMKRRRIERLCRAATNEFLHVAGENVINNARTSMKSKSPSAPGRPPAKVSHSLANSIVKRVSRVDALGRGEVNIGSSLPYALIQEIGGTINAKGKKLLVPLSKKWGRTTAARTTKMRASMVFKSSGGPSIPMSIGKSSRSGGVAAGDYQYLRLSRRGGQSYLEDPATHEALFVLKDSVYLPPRPYLRPALKKTARRTNLVRLLYNAFQRYLGSRAATAAGFMRG